MTLCIDNDVGIGDFMFEILDRDAFIIVNTPVCATYEEAEQRCEELRAKLGLEKNRLVPVLRGV